MTHSDQIEMCCNKIDSNIHTEILAKTIKAVKLRNVFFTQSLLPNIFLPYVLKEVRILRILSPQCSANNGEVLTPKFQNKAYKYT